MSASATRPTGPRLDGVDLLRGLAILTVLLNHVNMRLFLAKIPYTAGLPDQLVATVFWSGQMGVQIFFAVSGFLITSTSLRRWGSLSNLDPPAFYRLRFARIAPLLIALLLVLSVLHAMGLKDFVVPQSTGGLDRALLAALTLHVNWLEATHGYLPGNWDILWSLSVEEMFYLFFPLTRWLRGKGLIVLLSVLMVLGPISRGVFAQGNEVWHEYSYLGGMDAIAFGCLTAIGLSGRTFSRPVVRSLGVVGAALLTFSLGFSNLAEAWGLGASGLDMTVVAIGTCLVICAAAQSQWAAPRILLPITRLGERSYEIYLTHMFVVFALFRLFKTPVPLLFVATILGAALLGEVVARSYSEPMNRWLRQNRGGVALHISHPDEPVGGRFLLQQSLGRDGPTGKQVLAVIVGNGLEYYDFVTYAFFASQIGRAFFPSNTPGTSLLASLATFGVGFLSRPLGALVIGRLGDRVGRKPAMLLSFFLIGVGVIGLPLIPPYSSIGLYAPLLAIVLRLVQGFALGGEVGPSTAFLMEAAPPLRRGLYVSLQATSADFAVFVAGLVGVGLASVLDAAELDAWGWRVALLLGASIVPFGLLMRRRIDETLKPSVPEVDGPPPHGYGRIVVLGLVLLSTATTTNYLLQYMTTYASVTLGMPAKIAFGATAVIGLSGMFCDSLGGWLSDRFGRKPIMIIPWLFLAVAVFPTFWMLDHLRTGSALYIACGLLASISTLSSATVIVAITESLPQRVRSGGMALIYALAISVFGGSAQFTVAWLIRATGNPLAPAWYMFCGVIIGLIALFQLPETAPVKARATATESAWSTTRPGPNQDPA